MDTRQSMLDEPSNGSKQTTYFPCFSVSTLNEEQNNIYIYIYIYIYKYLLLRKNFTCYEQALMPIEKVVVRLACMY